VVYFVKENAMAIRIIDDGCQMAGTQATVVVEGDSPQAVSSTVAKQEVLKKAASLGLSRPGISGQGGAYPVDNGGAEITDLASGVPAGSIYRNDFQVSSGL
tara:strand:- start:149 stop:451 length:303 start_codon:yes stop_codon:yes gene_type:complete